MLHNEIVTLRPLEVGDLQMAHALSQLLGWSHRLEDWNCMFALGRGFVAIGSNAALIGVALWWESAEDFASLGMVIVHPKQQRQGIGRRLLMAIIAAVGKRRIQLHATSEGLRLYESLGFVASGEMCVHLGKVAPDLPAPDSKCVVRAMSSSDVLTVRCLDLCATGIGRQRLLASLEMPSKGCLAELGAEACGFAFCRHFGKWIIIGPMVAESEETAIALTYGATRGIAGFLQINIPSNARLLAAWLTRAGLPESGRVTTMWRGEPPTHNPGLELFALASQAFG
jgi:GNAT superfamily N-acetyltransferase